MLPFQCSHGNWQWSPLVFFKKLVTDSNFRQVNTATIVFGNVFVTAVLWRRDVAKNAIPLSILFWRNSAEDSVALAPPETSLRCFQLFDFYHKQLNTVESLNDTQERNVPKHALSQHNAANYVVMTLVMARRHKVEAWPTGTYNAHNRRNLPKPPKTTVKLWTIIDKTDSMERLFSFNAFPLY